mmetsp:Transcript_13574/g.20170  ORF Transcript_13574/g.20170 Transcript_13574/m.20170 type:complete len:96 (-) Transcript_13574:264-551(-)
MRTKKDSLRPRKDRANKKTKLKHQQPWRRLQGSDNILTVMKLAHLREMMKDQKTNFSEHRRKKNPRRRDCWFLKKMMTRKSSMESVNNNNNLVKI